MDMKFTPEQLAFREEVRAFIKEKLPEDIRRKVAQGLELNRDDHQRWMRILAEKGWLATNWETKDGGPGWSVAEKYIFEEELSVANAPEVVPFGTRMVGPVLLAFGTEEQKRKWLPGILSGDTMWCQGYSEPGAGSDLASLTTSARREGDYYIVNGSKIWTSHGHYADMMFALVRTSKEGKKQEGITCLLIDMKSEGLDIRPLIKLDGRHKFNQEYFTDVKVPVENRVGEEGQGWTIAKYLLGHERGSGGGVASAQATLELLKKIASQERRDGRPLAEDPDFRRKIVDLETALMTLEVGSLRTLARASADKPMPLTAAAGLKLGMAELRKALTEACMEAGSYYAMPYSAQAIRFGWNEEPIGPEYLFKMAPEYFEYRARSIAGGTNEVQKNIIAKHALGL